MTRIVGPIVWSFFIYAEQINLFIKNKSTCLNIILNICSSLPCPLCTNHALNF